MNKALLEESKAKLLAEKQRLLGILKHDSKQEGKGEFPGEYKPEYPEVGDKPDDNAYEVEQFETNLALSKGLEKKLEKVEAALQRIEDGTYGKDAQGKEIPEARLRAVPEADWVGRMLKKLASLILLDQITKAYFVSRDFFVPNFGLPLGLDFGRLVNVMVIGIALLFFLWLYVTMRDSQNQKLNYGFVFLFAGAVSNLGDRIFLGFVRDFVDFGLGFTFNLADVFVVVGLLLILSQRPKNAV